MLNWLIKGEKEAKVVVTVYIRGVVCVKLIDNG